jgi:hypothetical protein
MTSTAPTTLSNADSDRIPEGTLLAAVRRGQLHQAKSEGQSIAAIKEQLGLRHTGWTTRTLRPPLEALVAAGLLTQQRRWGRIVWAVTARGRRRASPFRVLPESPQHRKWREATALAPNKAEAVRQGALAIVEHAQALLASPLDAGPDAKTWRELGRRLEKSMRVMASLTFCLREWDEPDDRRAEPRPSWAMELRNTYEWGDVERMGARAPGRRAESPRRSPNLASAAQRGTLEPEND